MNDSVRETAKQIFSHQETYHGYPRDSDRLRLSDAQYSWKKPLDLPDGPWEAGKKNTLPSHEESLFFIKAGYEVDTVGRPLHPWIQDMITNPDIGVFTGKGTFYNWGPNYTADPIVITTTFPRRIALVKRAEGKWALPGGFIDPEDVSALQAAVRELHEEAGLSQIGEPIAKIYAGVVSDARTTAHAWPETSAYLWHVDEQLPLRSNDPDGGTIRAEWVSEDDLNADMLYGSHAELIRMALEYQPPSSLKEVLDLAPEILHITRADGGHMAYDHLFVDTPDTHLFVKAHDSTKFSDPFREQHSKQYLKKEQLYFGYLRSVNYNSIPDRSELIDDSILVMDGLRENQGWTWRAPTEIQLQSHYVRDVLGALTKLGEMSIPEMPYHTFINPTYSTLFKEGWDDINIETLGRITQRIESFSTAWTKEEQQEAQSLIENLPSLMSRGKRLPVLTELVLGHNDARQSNIAWHPEHGAKLVDWSWADPIPKKADTTMFLIDLAKSDIDVSEYTEKYFDEDHAVLLIGFLLAHSLWNTRDSDQTVRIHQVASAIKAHSLLKSS